MTPARANRHPEAGPPLTVGRRIVRKAVVESTMDEVRAAARAGEPEGLVILAGRQSAGRGRHGRRWLDAPGRDLLASVLLRPDERIAGGLLMMAALAAARTVDALTGARSTIKWPNDVRVGGRKVCGVLAESEAGPDGIAVVLGIGLNVNSDPSGRPDLAATSLRLVAGREVPLDEAERILLGELDALYRRLLDGGSVQEEWAGRLDTIGSDVEVTWRSGAATRSVRGRAQGVDSTGRLRVRDGAGHTWLLAAGEVTLQVRPPDAGAGESTP